MPSPRIRLRLYVQPGDSGQALSLLYKALEFHDYSDYQLAIIDIKQEPEKALQDGIVKTPTVVFLSPDGEKITSYDLANTKELRNLFGFRSHR